MPFDFLKKQKSSNSQNPMATTSSTGRYPGDVLIGDLMVQAGVISHAQLDEAVKLAGNKHLQLGQMLIMAGHISPRDLQAAVDAQSMLRDKALDQNMATRCLKIACKTGMNFVDVFRDQEGTKVTGSVSNKLGELLLEANLIDREQFGKSMQRSLATGLPLGRILVLNGALSETLLNTALEIQVRLRDGMLTRVEAVDALRGQVGDMDSDEVQRQTLTLQTALATPRKKGVRLGELMVLAGLLNETDVMNALELGLVNDQPIGEVMVAQGFLTPEMLNCALDLQKKVDDGQLQSTEAGQVLAKISSTGVQLEEAVAEFIAPQEPVYEALTFDRMLILSRVISEEQIEESFQRALANPQTLAKLLVLTEHISNPAMQAVLQCYSMMSNNFLSQDDAIIALDYCLNEAADRNITFGEALQELGWSATQSIQMQSQNSVAVTHIRLQAMMHPDGSLIQNGEEVADGPTIYASHDAVSQSGEADSGYSEDSEASQAQEEQSQAWLPEESNIAEPIAQTSHVFEEPTAQSEYDAAEEQDNLEAVGESIQEADFTLIENEGQAEEQTVDAISEPQELYSESAEMSEAANLVDASDNFDESEVVNASDDADFAEVFEVVEEPFEKHVEEPNEDFAAMPVESEFSQFDAVASSASVPVGEHEAIVAGPDDAAENAAFREEFALDVDDTIAHTDLALPVEPPSLAELMGQAKAVEDKMAAEAQENQEAATARMEQEINSESNMQEESLANFGDSKEHEGERELVSRSSSSSSTSATGSSGSTEAGSLRDLFKPESSPAEGGNGYGTRPSLVPAQSPSPLTAVAASTQTSVASDSTATQAPKALGDLFKANAPAASTAAPSAPNSLQSMLSQSAPASAAASPPAPPASGGLSGLLSGIATPPPAPAAPSALQALTPESAKPVADESDKTKDSQEAGALSALRSIATTSVPAAPAASAPQVTSAPAPTPAPAPSAPVASPASAAPTPQAAPAPQADAPVPTAAPVSAVATAAPTAAPPAAPVQAAPVQAAPPATPVAPPPLTAIVQQAQGQPVPVAEPGQSAFDESANRLAESYYEQGNFAEAQKLYERILAAKEQQLGAGHPSLGADLTNLAGVMCVQGLFKDAEPFVRRVCILIEQAEPLDHLKLADSLNTLAGILFQQGRFADCEPLLGRALKLRQQKLGSDHPEIADNLRDYAKLLRKLQREEEAELMYAQAKMILSKRPQQPVAQ